MLIKEDAEWYGRANVAGKLFDSVRCKGCFTDFLVIKYPYHEFHDQISTCGEI